MSNKTLEKPVTKRRVVKALLEGDMTQTEIANVYQVDPSAISHFKVRHAADIAERAHKMAAEEDANILASKARRLEKLHDLYSLAEDVVLKRGGLTLVEPKWVGPPMQGERVDIERFDAPLYSALRATLDDIAAEEGARPRGALVNIDNRQQILVRRYELPGEVDPSTI